MFTENPNMKDKMMLTMEECLEDPHSRQAYMAFIEKGQYEAAIAIFNIWLKAEIDLSNGGDFYDEISYANLILQAGHLSLYKLATMTSCRDKLLYIKSKCVYELLSTHREFLRYMKWDAYNGGERSQVQIHRIS